MTMYMIPPAQWTRLGRTDMEVFHSLGEDARVDVFETAGGGPAVIVHRTMAVRVVRTTREAL